MSDDLLREQLRIYKKALQFYGDPDNYGDYGEYWKIVIDGGKTARNAIEKARNVEEGRK